MNWNQVISEQDVRNINDFYDNFHDTYLKEICYSTGSYVSEDLQMYEKNEPTARFLFQRPYGNPSVLEIEFCEVIQLNIKPVDKSQFTDILISHLYLECGIFFWSTKDYELQEADKESHTWIAAKSVRWRIRDDLLGSKMAYMK